jgi:hypothetical protein
MLVKSLFMCVLLLFREAQATQPLLRRSRDSDFEDLKKTLTIKKKTRFLTLCFGGSWAGLMGLSTSV